MSGKEGNLNERDIEDYLSKLEGGWLSEDGLDDQDSDDENRDADEVIRVMQEENDDDDDDVDETADIDPPLVEPEDQESSHPSTSSNLQGSFEERVSVHDGIDLSCVAWKDNKIVTLLSSYSGALPLTKVNRFDRTTKEKIDITCPFIVQEYNKHMGGVDLMDSFLGRNHIKMRSKKWYLRIFFHLFDLAIINSWIIYKRNAQERGEPKKSLLTMGQFRNELAFVLCTRGTTKEAKRGRPSTSLLEEELQLKKRKGSPAPPPPKDIRKDGAEHWPKVGGSLRCKFPKIWEICTGIVE
ncbi:unnamed protein product [Parnassius apollo]|uniref:(apollo) hypothetical protein n=1 Tax=Parnassius apollo TaxID=110799 RepID=A0A8S3XS66_PARAO|nr:unnamed protein product [Parnassius apollo]